MAMDRSRAVGVIYARSCTLLTVIAKLHEGSSVHPDATTLSRLDRFFGSSIAADFAYCLAVATRRRGTERRRNAKV